MLTYCCLVLPIICIVYYDVLGTLQEERMYLVPAPDTDELRQPLVATWAEFQQIMRLISVEKDWKHVSMQKVATLNFCCDVACLTFQLPHTTTGSFQSH